MSLNTHIGAKVGSTAPTVIMCDIDPYVSPPRLSLDLTVQVCISCNTFLHRMKFSSFGLGMLGRTTSFF
jgi:hypothetical protein